MQTAPPVDFVTDPLGPIRKAVAGRYDIGREVGHGAFATVYLARDLRHDRQVAFKVLNADPNSETGELRFLREIRLLARLQHPNILPLIDSGHADALLFYVMPFINGETLRQRMQREPQMPIEETVGIIREAADALAYAHQKGVIHRDVKPENILLSAGRPMVADFGIARAIDIAGLRTLTRTGIGSPGTPAYMSPEQLMGDQEIDRRTDIYSLGSVMYEALTGRPAFPGKEGLVKRFTEAPPLPSVLRDRLPADLDDIVTKAMARDVEDRYDTATDLATALAHARLGPAPSSPTPSAIVKTTGEVAASRPSPRPYSARPASDWTIPDTTGFFARDEATRRRWLRGAWIGAAVTAIALVVVFVAKLPAKDARGGPAADTSIRRWDVLLPDSAPLAFVGVASLGIGRPSLAVAPDGTRLVYVARKGNTTQLYARDLDRLDAVALPGTDGAYDPFYSPDGRWVAFFSGTDLKKISVADGQIVTLARVNDPLGGDWSQDGRILIGDAIGDSPSWVPSAGGTLQPIALNGATRRQWRYPRLLPDGKWVLHTDWDGSLSLSSVTTRRGFAITADAVSPRESTDVSKLIFGTYPSYIDTGHILYLTPGGVLMALPFDASTRSVLGPPAPVAQGIRTEAEAGAGQFAIARDGTLIYAPGVDAGISRLVWFDMRGRLDTLPFPPAGYGSFDLSPNGKQLLIRVQPASGRAELRIMDLEKGTQTRIGMSGIPLDVPRWWPDSKQILVSEFTAAGGLAAPVMRVAQANMAVRDTILAAATAYGVSPDGRRIAVTGWKPGLWVLPLDHGGGDPVRLTADAVAFPVFSPDGHWVVFTATDPVEVYAASADHPEERYRISTDGGEEALWSPSGDEIIYRNRQQFLAASVSTKNGFKAERPRVLFEGSYLNVPGWSHAIAPDGRRHLILLGSQQQTTNQLVVVTNWFREVARLAPASRN